MGTSVVWHPACALHQAGAGHPERPERIAAVLEALRAPALAADVEWVEAALAPRGGGPLDPDTVLGLRSWEAALASAGVALTAVERGIAQEGATAFGAT